MTHVTLCFPKHCDEERLNKELEATGRWNCMNEYRNPTAPGKPDGIHALVVMSSDLARSIYKTKSMTVVAISMPSGVTLSAIEAASRVVENHR